VDRIYEFNTITDNMVQERYGISSEYNILHLTFHMIKTDRKDNIAYDHNQVEFFR
jgi:hypothetical protein